MNNNNSSINFDKLNLADILDVKFLQRFLDTFADSIGVATIAVDINGNPITEPSNFTRFCIDLTRGSNEGLKRCMQCDAQGGKMSSETGRPAVYECHAGLVDFGAPIMLEGKQVGSILGGQVLTEEPDEEKFRKIAREIGVNEDEYIEALKLIKPIPREQVEKSAELLFMVAQNISQMGLRKYKISKVVETLNDNLGTIASTMEELAAAAITVSETQQSLTKEINNVSNLSGKINDFTNFIKKIADETRLLGLNAYIEAAKANEAGKGFSVVAQRIRKLSDNSKETVLKISEFTGSIEESVERTVDMGQNTLSTSEQQAAAIEEVTASVQELTEIAHQLMDLTK